VGGLLGQHPGISDGSLHLSLDELLAGRTRYHMVKRKVERGALDPEELYRRVRSAAPGQAAENTEDGLRMAWPEAREWLHVRPSGTEPILRIIAEAPSLDRAEQLAGIAGRCVEAGVG